MRRLQHLVILGLGLLYAGACSGTTTSAPVAPPEDGAPTVDALVDGGGSTVDGISAPDAGPEEVTEPEVTEPEVIEPEVIEEDTGPPEPEDCEPALDLTADSAYELPYGLVPLQPTGGTGAYLFTLAESGSGALINQLTGAYLAGGTANAQDVIELTDGGCIGSAQFTIQVVPPMTLKPATAQVIPATSFQLDLADGSGFVSCAMAQAGSGGTVTASGLYTAGDGPGTDVIYCTDPETGESLQATYTVDTEAALVATPPQITLPMGSTFVPRLQGGSGHVTFSVDGDAAIWEDGALVGLDPGQVIASGLDLYTGQQIDLTVDVVAPLQVETVRAGDASYRAQVIAPGDIDGDGMPDIVLAIDEVDVVAVDGGAVYVYGGKEGGLEALAAPAQILAGESRRDRFGRGAAVDDLDQDGHLDLVVAVSDYDGGATNNGGLLLYRGIPNGFFETEPYQVLVGLFAYDNLGYGVVACDVNGDGWVDLVGGARHAENRDLEVQPTNQGGLYVFLGSEQGYGLKADQILYGKLPEGGSWVDAANLKMGFRVAGGDFDGDGLCDVVAGSNDYSAGPGRTNDGAAFLYQGQPKTDTQSGGLSPLPVRAWAGFEGATGSYLGRRLALGDIDGDGKDELLLSQYREEDPSASSGINQGALRVIQGGELTAQTPELLAPSTADLSIFADNGGDGMGWYAATGDVNGDGIDDLLVTGLADEVPGGTVGTGTVAVHLGQDGALPSQVPDRIIGGLVNGDVFGLAAEVWGDLDGDGAAEIFVYAGRDDTLGIDVGIPYLVRGLPEANEGGAGEGGEGQGEGDEEPPPELVPLDMPSPASGSQVGRGVAVLQDLNGDGWSEVAVGSPNVDNTEANHLNRGQVTIYAGGADGVSTEPLYVLEEHTGHSNSDFVGYQVADAGDFDGDGNPDVAVLARGEDRPSNFNNAAYAPDIACTGSSSNTGAVFIYRSDGTTLLKDEPAFIWYGTQKGQNMERMAAGLDINGDGLDDFVAGADDWDRTGHVGAGGFSVVLGRWHWNDPKIDVICEPEFTFVGLLTNDRVASDIAALGDVNGDGCDDFAVGANAEDIGGGARGSVRVFFGWNDASGSSSCDDTTPCPDGMLCQEDVCVSGCPAEASYVYLSSMLNNAQAGISVAGGLDMDGDQIPDLVVGGHNLTVDSNRVGAAWFIPGAYIASLPPEPVVDGEAPVGVYPFIPQEVNSGTWMISGEVDDEEFGRAVAQVPNVVAPGVAAMAVGGPLGNQPGVLRAGGVGIYGVNADPDGDDYGLGPIPLAVFGGETDRAGGLLGRMLSGGLMGTQPVLMVGGYEASGLGLDQGAAYLMKLAPP